jgi:hypothetical protein
MALNCLIFFKVCGEKGSLPSKPHDPVLALRMTSPHLLQHILRWFWLRSDVVIHGLEAPSDNTAHARAVFTFLQRTPVCNQGRPQPLAVTDRSHSAE